MKTNIFRKILGTFAVLALALGVGVALRSAVAGTETGSGWLWGGSETVSDGVMNGNESGTGWISMNDTNPGSGGGTYGVNIPDSGDISGYAWSENLGWISFNGADLAGCPLVPAARSGSNITGGARILSIRDAGANAGGWDGCVSLSGTATDGSPYGVSVDTMPNPNKLSGFAWSGDLGWIDFSRATVAIVVPPDTLSLCTIAGIPIASGTATLPRSLTNGNSESFNAFYDPTPVVCGDSAPIADANWTENVGSVVVSLTGTNASPQTVTSNAVGTEQVTVTKGADTITLDYTVGAAACVKDCTDAPNVCRGETFNDANGCGTNNCEGGRFCDFNWKEVAPGQ